MSVPRAFLATLAWVGVVLAPLACNSILGNRNAVSTDADAGDDGPAFDAAGESGAVEASPPRDAQPSDSRILADTGGAACPSADAGYTVLAHDNGVVDVALDSANVYWIDGTSVNGCPRAGCGGAPTVYFGGGSNLAAIAESPATPTSFLYWADSMRGTVSFCSPPSCGSPTSLSALGARALAFDSTNAYWIEQGAIGYCPIGSACMPSPFATEADAIAGGGTNVFFTSVGGLYFCPPSTCPIGGSFIFKVEPQRIAVDPSGLPVCVTVPPTNPSTGEVDCIFSLGTLGAPMPIATSLPYPDSVGIDATYVYWTDLIAKSLFRCPIRAPCGASPELLATFPDRPGPFVLDSSTIVGVVEGACDFVYALPKPL